MERCPPPRTEGSSGTMDNWSTMIKCIFTSNDRMSEVYEDDAGKLYLVALCAGIAWMHVGIVLDDVETAEFRGGDTKSIDALARQMCFDFASFKSRTIPDAIRQQISGRP